MSPCAVLLHRAGHPARRAQASHRCPVRACPAISHGQAHAFVAALCWSLYLASPPHAVAEEWLIGRRARSICAAGCCEGGTNGVFHMQKTTDAQVCDSKSRKESEACVAQNGSMDALGDDEFWCRPVVGCRFAYEGPRTDATAISLSHAHKSTAPEALHNHGNGRLPKRPSCKFPAEDFLGPNHYFSSRTVFKYPDSPLGPLLEFFFYFP
jgi:hypothetical protein